MTSTVHEREQMLTVAEVAMELGCSAPTVRRWIHEGHLAAHKIGPGRAGLVRIRAPRWTTWSGGTARDRPHPRGSDPLRPPHETGEHWFCERFS